jgi:hypothetical protein
MAESSSGRNKNGAQHRRKIERHPAHPVERLRLNTDENNVKWLFHRDADARWRWQKVSAAEGLLSESTRSHASYGDCVMDAKAQGYTEWLAPAKLTPLSFSHVQGPVQCREAQLAGRSQNFTGTVKTAPRRSARSKKARTASKVIPLRGHGAA